MPAPDTNPGASAQPSKGPVPTTPPLWWRLVFGRNPKRTLIRAAVLGSVVFLTFRFVLLGIRVDGRSMDPTYRDGSFNLVNRLAYVRHKPRRGDVVALRPPGNPTAMHLIYLKRIIGLPGETLSISNGTVFIDDKPLDEPYLLHPMRWEKEPLRLGADEYYVIGDNRRMPQEMHDFGLAYGEQIFGKVLW